MNDNSQQAVYKKLHEYHLPDMLPAIQVIAEIGCNHCGQVNIAKQMIVVAKTCGANIAKFQKRTVHELLTREQYDAPYVNPHSYGRTYGEHREFLEFDIETHAMLKSYAEDHGIEYASSVWDLTSAREIASLNPQCIKVPSACNNHMALLELLRDEYSGDVHLSTGMSTAEEIAEAVDVFAACPERVVLYHCVSGYPIRFDEVALLELVRLVETYKRTGRVREIGFSGHHNGIAIDLFAPVLGATYIERHFTLDRTWKGSDHAASLEPQGFSKMVRDTQHAIQAWSFKSSEILPVEEAQRIKLKYRPH